MPESKDGIFISEGTIYVLFVYFYFLFSATASPAIFLISRGMLLTGKSIADGF
jgi:hypothetical protein